ncbi:MAG: hypothetical protein ACK4GN_08700 [Runella sp.]
MKLLLTYILSTVLLVQSLLPRPALGLLQSVEVWQHYREHQREQSQPLGLWDFFMMHFSADSEHTKQKKHHLPTFDFNSTVGLFVLPSAVVSLQNPSIHHFLYKANFLWLNLYKFQTSQVLICPPRA